MYAWTLTEYERVVHVDMDCLLLHPIDELLSIDASLVYTADYNMMNDNQRKNRLTPAVQGGFGRAALSRRLRGARGVDAEGQVGRQVFRVGITVGIGGAARRSKVYYLTSTIGTPRL